MRLSSFPPLSDTSVEMPFMLSCLCLCLHVPGLSVTCFQRSGISSQLACEAVWKFCMTEAKVDFGEQRLGIFILLDHAVH